MTAPVLELRGVSKRFSRPQDVFGRVSTRLRLTAPPPVLQAVTDISLAIQQGEVLGLVGESGCGKSTVGRMAASHTSPSAGEVLWHGQDAACLPRAARLRTQMIFQDPFASLNPRKRVAEIVGEAPRVHRLIEGDREAYVDAQLRRAGLDPADKHRYPHQFSGGQRQRIGIARALAVQPDLLVCDEAVAALDVSIQAQILNLFMTLRRDLDLSYLFISHDLGVIEHIADRVAIMYLGRIVEEAPVDVLFRNPGHPYTRALLAEIPRLDARGRTFAAIKGELPSPLAPPPGCAFHPRCPQAQPRCTTERPSLRVVGLERQVACHFVEGAS